MPQGRNKALARPVFRVNVRKPRMLRWFHSRHRGVVMATARSIGSTDGAIHCAPTPFNIDPALVLSSGFLATLAITTVMSVLLWFGVAQVDLPIWVSRL